MDTSSSFPTLTRSNFSLIPSNPSPIEIPIKQGIKQASAYSQLQQVNISFVPPQPTRSMQPTNPPLVLCPCPHPIAHQDPTKKPHRSFQNKPNLNRLNSSRLLSTSSTPSEGSVPDCKPIAFQVDKRRGFLSRTRLICVLTRKMEMRKWKNDGGGDGGLFNFLYPLEH